MNIQIICLGTLKEEYLKIAQEDLLGKILKKNRVTGVNVLELKEEPLKENASEATILKALDMEGQRILEKLPGKGRIICLDIQGRKASHEYFAGLFDGMDRLGEKDLTVIIGGSHGISDTVKRKAERISFSRLTYPHQLFRIAVLDALALYLH